MTASPPPVEPTPVDQPSDATSDGSVAPTAHIGPQDAPFGPPPATPAEFKDRVIRHFTPPDLWTTGRPPLERSWRWALYGEHIPDDQMFRTAARVVIGFTIPLRAALLFCDWLLEHPSRALAAGVLIFVLVMAFL